MGLKEQLAQWAAEVAVVQFNTAEVEAFRIQWLGRKGKMKDVMADFKAAPNEEKRELGKLINEFKQQVEQRVAEGRQTEPNPAVTKRLNLIGRVPTEAFRWVPITR